MTLIPRLPLLQSWERSQERNHKLLFSLFTLLKPYDKGHTQTDRGAKKLFWKGQGRCNWPRLVLGGKRSGWELLYRLDFRSPRSGSSEERDLKYKIKEILILPGTTYLCCQPQAFSKVRVRSGKVWISILFRCEYLKLGLGFKVQNNGFLGVEFHEQQDLILRNDQFRQLNPYKRHPFQKHQYKNQKLGTA